MGVIFMLKKSFLCIEVIAVCLFILSISGIISMAEDKMIKEEQLVQKERDPACVKECQRRLLEKVKICNSLFNSSGSVYYHDTQWHSKCLQNAKDEYDNCLSLCDR